LIKENKLKAVRRTYWHVDLLLAVSDNHLKPIQNNTVVPS
jgi:hypothetical protein